MRKVFLFLSILFFAGCLPEGSGNKKEISFAKETISILCKDRREVVFNVEIADTNSKRARGLMYRTDTKDNEGMLFLFPVNRKASMWMANTPQSLDMLFIDERGEIKQIVEDTVPFSHDEIRSEQKVKGVLELKAGISKREGIKVGDIVKHSFFNLEKENEKL